MKTKKSKEKNIKKKLQEIDTKEHERLGSSSVVNTKSFSTRQSFGAASEVRQISAEEYLRNQ